MSSTADLSALPILEPLSEATETELKPPNFFPTDFLELDITDDMKWFQVQAMSYRPDPNGSIEIDGLRLKEWGMGSSVARQWFKRVPEKTEWKGNAAGVQLAATDFTAILIRHAWQANRLNFKSDAARTMYKYLLTRFFSQTRSARIIADFKTNGVVPELPPEFQDPSEELTISPYQRVGVAASLFQEMIGLFMEQGTGKTAVTVSRFNTESAIRRRENKNLMYKVLVICPPSIRSNWERECCRFCTYPGKVTVLRGGQLNRSKCLIDAVRHEPEKFYWSCAIVAQDSAVSMMQFLLRVPWDLIVWDESHNTKWYRTERFKAFSQFNDASAKQKMILTGTPIANSVMDLYAQFELLGKGASGFNRFESFKKFHGKFKALNGSPIQKLVGIKSIPLIQERLARMSYLITKKEAHLNLPAKVYDMMEVYMTPRQTKIYKDLAGQLAAEIEDDLNDETKTITVDHILTKLLRLAQVTSGHVRYDGEFNEETEKPTAGAVEQIDKVNPKVSAIIEAIKSPEADPKGKRVIWACFREDLRILSEKMAEAGINHVGYHNLIQTNYRVKDAAMAESRFNLDTECMVFLGNPASAREGLNLLGYDRENPDVIDMYVTHEDYFSCSWSMIHRVQSEDRVHRRGARSNVQITDWVVPGTIDEEIRARVLSKKHKAMQIQDVKEILAKVLEFQSDAD